jgi:signal peptidase I
MSNVSNSAKGEWLPTLQSLLGTVIIAIFVITFAMQAFQIPSESMENTLLIGDYLLVDKLCYGEPKREFLLPYRPVRRDDIIVFRYPVNPQEHFVKRVIGVPGDRIKLVEGKVYVNEIPVREPYVRHTAIFPDDFRDNFPQLNLPVPGLEGKWWLEMKKLVQNGELHVPQDSYFVLGDNRDESLDSRYWGLVPRRNIVGRPLLIYWSFREDSDETGTDVSAREKLFHFAYALTHLFQTTRWDRTFHVVR